MSISLQFVSVGTPGVTADFAQVALRVGLCTGGTAGELYQFSPGQDPTATLGYGPLARCDAAAAALVPNAQRYCLKVAAASAGTISSVTQTGTGPLITVAGSTMDGVSDTPFGAFTIKVKVRKGGILGVAQVDIAVDGAEFNYSGDVPAKSAPTVIGTVDVTAFTWGDGGTIDTLKVKIGASTCTFVDPADEADMLAQLEAALTGYGFDLVQGKYLRITGDTAGASSSFSVDAASTADGTLGLNNDAHTGSDSTIAVGPAGFVMTFPAGTYVEGEIYSFTTTAPRASLSSIVSAISTAANANPLDRFGLLYIVQDPLDEVDWLAYATQLDTLCAAWEAADDKRFVVWLLGGPLSISDATAKATFLSHTSRHGALVHRECWLPSSTPQPAGSLKVSLAEQLLIRSAQRSFSEDPGFGGFGPLECSLKSPDGALARIEATASIKMGGSRGPGFTVATTKGGKPYFVRGVTRAGSTSRFVDLGVARATMAMGEVLFGLLGVYENATFELNGDGTMQEGDCAAIDLVFDDQLERLFVPDHFSRVIARVDRAEKIADSRKVKIAWTAQIRGQGEFIEGVLSVAGVLLTTQ